MTNNPTIDGVSRAMIERIADRLSTAQMFKESTELRALLDAHVVERQPVAFPGYPPVPDDRKMAPPEVAALQSTIAQLQARVQELESGQLAVWYGTMPESNGKTNWTAILHRKSDPIYEGCCITLDRSEYPDRVRYEADRVRYLIGELEQEPFILDYDANKHSGYTATSAPVAVVLPERKECEPYWSKELDADFEQRLEWAEARGWNLCIDATSALNGERK